MRNTLDIWRGDSWSPVRELSLLQRGIDRLFDDMLTPFSPSGELDVPVRFNPACDVEETETYFMVSFDLDFGQHRLFRDEENNLDAALHVFLLNTHIGKIPQAVKSL